MAGGPSASPGRGRQAPPVDEQAISLDDATLTSLLRRSLATPHKRVVWTGPGIDLLVRLDRTRAATLKGGVVVGFEVDGGEGAATATVTFAVGTAAAPAGLVAAAGRPDLPASLAPWSEAVVAAAWRGILDVATAVAAPLVPAALVAAPGHLDVVPRPSYDWERDRWR